MLLRKYFWVVNLLTITICAVFAANAAGKLLESKLPRPPAGRVETPPPGVGAGLAGPTKRDITAILDRNIFCSTCEKVTETPVVAETGDENAQPLNNDPVKSSLNIKLLATLVSDVDKAWSYAALQDTSEEGVQGLVAIGGVVPGDSKAVVTDIMERRILLLNSGRNEYIDLLEEGEGQNSGISAVKRPSSYTGHRMPKAAAGVADIAKGIQKVGEGKYEIQRSALNKVLGNTTLLARSARIVPSVRNGKPNGFKLYAIRPGSLYSLLGMFNGDTISAINGHAITTPDKALEVYTKLRNASHISISFNRRGKELTHEYTIR